MISVVMTCKRSSAGLRSTDRVWKVTERCGRARQLDLSVRFRGRNLPHRGPVRAEPSGRARPGSARQGCCMPIKALNDRKKLSNGFNEANDAFIDEVLSALQGGRIPVDLARAYLAHPVAMMHTDGAQAVA